MSTRQLLQTSGTFTYPGCTPITSSVIATNPDFADLYLELNTSGVLGLLQNLESPATLFAFTNEAQEESVASYNHTLQQADTDPLIASAVYDGKLYTIVTEAIPVSCSIALDLLDFLNRPVALWLFNCKGPFCLHTFDFTQHAHSQKMHNVFSKDKSFDFKFCWIRASKCKSSLQPRFARICFELGFAHATILFVHACIAALFGGIVCPVSKLSHYFSNY